MTSGGEWAVWGATPARSASFNGRAFSCRERVATTFQNANDLAREAVSWNAVLDGSEWRR